MISYENSGSGYNNFVSSTRFSSLHVYLQKYSKYNTYMLCGFTVRAGFPVDVSSRKRKLRLSRAVLSPPLSIRTPAQPHSTIAFGPDSAQPWGVDEIPHPTRVQPHQECWHVECLWLPLFRGYTCRRGKSNHGTMGYQKLSAG